MKRAVILARSADEPVKANQLLDSVALNPGDFPWLADIRTLAKAEIANRFTRPEAEARFVDEFLARQPTLFEPDIALNFSCSTIRNGLSRGSKVYESHPGKTENT